jgi:methyltransferase
MLLNAAILGAITAERIAEIAWARRNTRRLLARGGGEVAAGHYPLIVGLHALWLAGLWIIALDRPVNLWFLALFAVLQVFRAWVLVTLGRRWTTRIVVVPGETLVAGGPYHFLPHPNYAVVALEMATLPLVFGLFWYAVLFSLLNAGVLFVRIRAEERALAEVRR